MAAPAASRPHISNDRCSERRCDAPPGHRRSSPGRHLRSDRARTMKRTSTEASLEACVVKNKTLARGGPAMEWPLPTPSNHPGARIASPGSVTSKSEVALLLILQWFYRSLTSQHTSVRRSCGVPVSPSFSDVDTLSTGLLVRPGPSSSSQESDRGKPQGQCGYREQQLQLPVGALRYRSLLFGKLPRD